MPTAGASGARGWLDSVRHVARIDLDDLQHIERQKNVIDRNTQQFIEKSPPTTC